MADPNGNPIALGHAQELPSVSSQDATLLAAKANRFKDFDLEVGFQSQFTVYTPRTRTISHLFWMQNSVCSFEDRC